MEGLVCAWLETAPEPDPNLGPGTGLETGVEPDVPADLSPIAAALPCQGLPWLWEAPKRASGAGLFSASLALCSTGWG